VASKKPPELGWAEYLRTRKPSAADLAAQLLELHNAKQHEEVIAGINAALIAGYSEPWMYEVLGLSLEIAGHPKEEVERALLSRIDFTAADVPNMLVSAAYLTRFGGTAQSLHLYRQASRLAPFRPEPYALGLKLAQPQKDMAALQWSATGILTNVWTADYAKWHKLAEAAADEAERSLRAEGKQTEADSLREAMRAASQRDLMLKLTWSGDADLDLVVEEPLGTVCSFASPQTAAGGFFIHDGYGPKPSRCYEEYVCPVAPSGGYVARIKYVSGNVVGKRAQLTVITHRGTAEENTTAQTVILDAPDKAIRVTLEGGRRQGPMQ
jgi:hypothetical protein